jgi:hypothetical protein
MIKIQEIVQEIKITIDLWHSKNLKWFEYDTILDTTDITNIIKKLAFHNYCGWHFIEGYQDTNKNNIQFVYDGGLEHNKYRNACMEIIDEFFYLIQKNSGIYNSEGFGSIFDRLINDYIKYVHLKETNDSRADDFYKQIVFLENALEQLYNEIIIGTRRITIFKKFKSSGY